MTYHNYLRYFKNYFIYLFVRVISEVLHFKFYITISLTETHMKHLNASTITQKKIKTVIS